MYLYTYPSVKKKIPKSYADAKNLKLILTSAYLQRASQMVLVVKNLFANAGDLGYVGSIPGLYGCFQEKNLTKIF